MDVRRRGRVEVSHRKRLTRSLAMNSTGRTRKRDIMAGRCNEGSSIERVEQNILKWLRQRERMEEGRLTERINKREGNGAKGSQKR